MSDGEEDEENYCFFGKPLEPYDEDAFPKKKPIAIEEQVARDAQGRRRFHGAFTGGFSAGFFNTVGSLEGWTPSEFKSTRQEKGQAKAQKPEDFMDDEDRGEFGFAPQTVKATKDYATDKKRKRHVLNDGPIPGEPVLHSLLSSGNETIGYLLLKNIGLKDKSVGEVPEENDDSKIYGCEMPKTYEIARHAELSEFPIAEVYKEFLKTPKSNTFGLGYSGLDKSHVNLFQSSNLVIRERNKKKVTISGQAFGVGAFEDDDEDIYVKDDMTKYDFELTAESSGKKQKKRPQNDIIFDEFIKAQRALVTIETFAPPTIPHSFTGKHKIKKSRFEPLPQSEPEIARKDMTPDIRGALYDGPKVTTPIAPTTVKEEKIENPESDKKSGAQSFLDLMSDRFVSATQTEDVSNLLEEVKPMETEHGTEEMRAAVNMKMFGPLTRISISWQPCSMLCRRFNVPEPKFDFSEELKGKKRTKNLIFEYQKFVEPPPDLVGGLDKTTSSEVELENNSEPSTSFIPNSAPIPEIKTEEAKGNETLPVVPPPPPPPVIDMTEKLGIEENVDLFKSVFLSSSSESEDEDVEEIRQQTNKDEELKASVLSEQLLLLPRIKPIKEGILSNIDFSKLESPQPAAGTSSSNGSKVEDNLYGPQLPANNKSLSSGETRNVVKSKIQDESDDDDDEWIELDQVSSNKKNKKHKKHKVKKHKKHRKHK